MALTEAERQELAELRARQVMAEDARQRATPRARNPVTVRNLLRSVGQGATLGFGDEMTAGVRSLLGEDYDTALEDERANIAGFNRAAPDLSVATELTGGLATGVGLARPVAALGSRTLAAAPGMIRDFATRLGSRFGRAAPVAQGAGLGAGTAAVGGFGQGEGGVGERLANAAQDAPLGGVLGAAAPVAMGAARGIYGAMTTPPAAKAEKKILQRLRSDQLTPDQLEFQLQGDRALNVPPTIATQGDNLRNLAEGVANIPGEGMTTSRRAIEQAHRGQGERISQALHQRTGGGDYVRKAADIDDAYKVQATPAYERAYAVDVNMMGSDVADLLQRVPPDELARAFDAAKRTYKASALNAGRPMREFMTFRRDAEGNVIDAVFPIDMNTKEWHAFIRGLREVKEDLFKRGAAHARDIDQVYKNVDRIGKTRNPLFADAQRLYSDTKSIEEAMVEGRAAMLARHTPADMRKMVAGMSANEREHFRAGAIQFLDEQLARQPDGANKAASLVNTGHIRNKLRAITPDPHEFEMLMATLQTEARDASRRSRMTMGSPTGERTEAIRDVKAEDEFMPQVVEAIQGPTQFARRWLAAKAAGLGTSRRTSDELGPMLHTTDPAEQAEILRRLRARQTQLDQENALATERYRAGSTAVGAASASPPLERTLRNEDDQ